MNVRPGTTLLEVLTAIFIMGIGLLALLTLFPVGATTMSKAMTDARAAETGNNAKSVCNTLNLRQDSGVTGSFNLNTYYNSAYNMNTTTATPPWTLPADWTGVSFPVFADPIGVNYIGYGSSTTITGSLVPRVAFSITPTASTALRWCSLWDDYTFSSSGSAALATGVTRESRFTYAYMMRRPNVQNASLVETNVVCYAGRNLQVAGGETVYAVSFSYGAPRTVTLTYAGDKPTLKRGGWILDVTTHNLNPQLNPWVTNNNPATNANDTAMAKQYGIIHGRFSRVVDFTEISGTQIELELQNMPDAPLYDATGGNGKIVIMDNVAEVFPIGTGRP